MTPEPFAILTLGDQRLERSVPEVISGDAVVEIEIGRMHATLANFRRKAAKAVPLLLLKLGFRSEWWS